MGLPLGTVKTHARRGLLQVRAGGGRAARWAAIVQSIGTVYFNVTTFRAMSVLL